MTKYKVKVDGRVYEVEVEAVSGAKTKQDPTPEPQQKKVSQPEASGDGTKVNSPLAGTILTVKAKVGAQVKAGDVLLTLEALKLENEITAPVSGTVAQIVNAGVMVETGDLLATIS